MKRRMKRSWYIPLRLSKGMMLLLILWLFLFETSTTTTTTVSAFSTSSSTSSISQRATSRFHHDTTTTQHQYHPPRRRRRANDHHQQQRQRQRSLPPLGNHNNNMYHYYSPTTIIQKSSFSSSISSSKMISSQLFSSSFRQQRSSKPPPSTGQSARQSSSTALHMVLTTPESIIEQASTVRLLDDLIDESVRTTARRPIMMQFDPSSGFIWRQWKGTVFSVTWKSALRNMMYALMVYFVYKSQPWINEYLSGIGTLWGQLLSVTTFTLTFFVNQSYALWRKCAELSRRIQGRLHDIGLNLASHAARKIPSNPNEPSHYTAASRQILELMSRYIRLFNLLTYASFTRSHRPILTPRGMRRLVERGLMTAQERQVLVDASIPATQRNSAVLMWMIRLYHEGRMAGHIMGGSGFEQQTMEKFHVLRSQYGAIGDELQGRMPLAYAHIVQVLVDLILWMYPIMALSVGMSPFLTVLGTGLLTTSYQGLFDLAKQFLDPYDNENYGSGEDPLSVDTLIAETNAGSVRWMNAFEEMPYSAQRLKDGELYDSLLPVRGYSVEELEKMEEERLQREKELEEQRIQEEEEAAEQLLEAERREKEQQIAQQEIGIEIEEDGGESEEGVEDRFMGEDEETIDVSGFRNKETNNLIGDATPDETVVDSAKVLIDLKAEGYDAVVTTDANQTTGTEVRIESDVVAIRNTTTDGTTKVKDDHDEDEEETTFIHKVTTLADGSPVSFPGAGSEVESNDSPVPLEISNTYLESLSSNTEPSRRATRIWRDNTDEDETTFVPDIIEYEMLQDLPWFELQGSDGQEIRLSQMMADEEWDEEKEVMSLAVTEEEFMKQEEELRTAARNELLETAEILGVTPGLEATEIVQEIEEKVKAGPPKYDQTHLDSLSQLWGLAPEDPSSFEVDQHPDSVDDRDFAGISQLWGQTVETSDEPVDNEIVGMKSFAGLSEMWGEDIEGLEDDNSSSDNSAPRGDSGSDGRDMDDIMSTASLMGFPSYTEFGPDGKETRLSQMLAEEEWEEVEAEPVEKPPITLEEYKEHVSEILTAAEEELLETEAIMMTAPGLDPIGWDEEEKLPFSVSNSSLFEENEIPQGPDDLDVLEMDKDDEDDEQQDFSEYSRLNETNVITSDDPSDGAGGKSGVAPLTLESSSEGGPPSDLDSEEMDPKMEDGSVETKERGVDSNGDEIDDRKVEKTVLGGTVDEPPPGSEQSPIADDDITEGTASDRTEHIALDSAQDASDNDSAPSPNELPARPGDIEGAESSDAEKKEAEGTESNPMKDPDGGST